MVDDMWCHLGSRLRRRQGFAMNDAELELRYEHAFDVRINFDRRWLTDPLPGGAKQGYTSVGEGCTVSGPLLQGKVVDHSGADWPIVRADGVVELNAHYMIQADDGALIYIRNLGYVHGPLRSKEQSPQETAGHPRLFSLHAVFSGPGGRPRMAEPNGPRRASVNGCPGWRLRTRLITRCSAILRCVETGGDNGSGNSGSQGDRQRWQRRHGQGGRPGARARRRGPGALGAGRGAIACDG